MLKYIKKLWSKWVEPVCKFDKGEYMSHCFHPIDVKVESCLKGVMDIKHECCRCGFVRDIFHDFY